MSTTVYPPLASKRYLVFDVETNGLMPSRVPYKSSSSKINDYPYILQLSFAIYDVHEKKLIQQFDSYIDVPDDVPISEKITSLTGIDRNMCKQGKPIIDVLEKFYEAYMFCNGLVAHNMDFDEKAIQVSIERYRDEITKKCPHIFSCFQPMYEKLHEVERYCTMKKGTDLCNIMVEYDVKNSTSGEKRVKKKWPRLEELHKHLFPNESLSGLHNSMVDVLVCLRCFLKMKLNTDPGSFI